MYKIALLSLMVLVIIVGVGGYYTSYKVVDASIAIDKIWRIDAKQDVWIMNTMVNWANYLMTRKHGSIRIFPNDNQTAIIEDEVIESLRTYVNGKGDKTFNGAHGMLVQGDNYFFSVQFIDSDPLKKRYGVIIDHAGTIVEEIVRD